MSCIKISQSAILPSKIIVQSASFKNVGDATADATAILNNTLGTELSSTSISAGTSGIIVAPNSIALIKKDGVLLQTVNVPSGVSEDINLIVTVV